MDIMLVVWNKTLLLLLVRANYISVRDLSIMYTRSSNKITHALHTQTNLETCHQLSPYNDTVSTTYKLKFYNWILQCLAAWTFGRRVAPPCNVMATTPSWCVTRRKRRGTWRAKTDSGSENPLPTALLVSFTKFKVNVKRFLLVT